MIQRNKHSAGRLSNVVFGLAQIGDGLVRVLSLGFAHSTFSMDVARRQALRAIQAVKAGER